MGNKSNPSLGKKVHSFANNRIGQQVGRGECYDLADGALKTAGAKSAPDYGRITPKADYKWGKEVNLLGAQPGDILQFKAHKIKILRKIRTVKRYSDGRWEEKTEEKWRTQNRGHHTAVVSSNDGKGVLTILEQHVVPPGGKQIDKRVRKSRVHVSNSKRNQPKKIQRKGKIIIEVETNTTVTVTGKIWVYRPEPKESGQ